MAIQVYNTITDYNDHHASGVSLILSDNTVMYDGVNVIKKRPKIGDFVVKVNGKNRFLDAATATSELLSALPVVGKVFDVQGKLVRIVGGVNDYGEKWSDVCDYHIVPDNSLFDGDAHSLDITLQNTYIGKMNYELAVAVEPGEELADFIRTLNRWLDENAPKWEAYINAAGEGILQMSTYDSFESTCTITSCVLTKMVGSELASETVNNARNDNGQTFNYYQIMCKPRGLEYFTANGSSPDTAISNIQPNTAPVSEAYFDGELGVNLRAKFGTYNNYNNLCMVHLKELNCGVMQFRDGRGMTAKLLTKTVLKRGVSECPYRFAVWANNYAPTFDGNPITGFEAGKWWSPSMYELGLLMRRIKSNHTDPVSLNMNLVPGWSYIRSASTRWSCCRYNSYSAWHYGSYGIVLNNLFYYSLSVSAVSAFEIED